MNVNRDSQPYEDPYEVWIAFDDGGIEMPEK